jgi:hypothetical protein
MKQSMTWFLALSTTLAMGSAAIGCGGDDSTPTGGSGGSGGSSSGGSGGSGKSGSGGTGGSTGGSGGSSGTAGKAGAAGAPADSGSDGSDGSTAIMCGTVTCNSGALMGIPLLPCCPAGEMNACGLLFATACLTTTPGTPDPSCPDVANPLGGTLPGCCTVTGFCGADIGAPLGCNDLSGATGGVPTPCGSDAAPPPRDAAADVMQPPSDTGPGSDTGGGDTGSGDTGSGDAGSGDGSQRDAPADGGATDASGDRSG